MLNNSANNTKEILNNIDKKNKKDKIRDKVWEELDKIIPVTVKSLNNNQIGLVNTSMDMVFDILTKEKM